MHNKQKGTIGELKVATDLLRRGLPIFKEIGDLSCVDLITILKNKPIKIQVKYAECKNGTIEVKFHKAGPNHYRYRYGSKDVDMFASYCAANDSVYYIPFVKVKSTNRRSIKLSINETRKNNQIKRINFARDWTFERALTQI